MVALPKIMKVGDVTIDVNKLWSSSRIVVRRYGAFVFYNACQHRKCSHNCRNCRYSNYYVRFYGCKRKYHLPNFIQPILRKIWN